MCSSRRRRSIGGMTRSMERSGRHAQVLERNPVDEGVREGRGVPLLGVLVLAVVSSCGGSSPDGAGSTSTAARRWGSRAGHDGADGYIGRRTRRGANGSALDRARPRGAGGRPRPRSRQRGPESMS